MKYFCDLVFIAKVDRKTKSGTNSGFFKGYNRSIEANLPKICSGYSFWLFATNFRNIEAFLKLKLSTECALCISKLNQEKK